MKLSKINYGDFYKMLMSDRRIPVETQVALRNHEKALTDITKNFDLYIIPDEKAISKCGDCVISKPFYEWQMWPNFKKLKQCVITQSGTDNKSLADTIGMLAQKAKEIISPVTK